MAMKDPCIEIHLEYNYEDKDLCVGTPENNEDCPAKEEIRPYFKGSEGLEAG